MNEIKLFENPEFGRVRVVMRGEDPWFVAKDVYECLALDTAHGARNLDEDEKGLHIMETPGGNQELSIISESGLYSLILRSRKPEAKAFKRWVTHEVLPQIRKTGTYGQAPQTYLEALEQCVALEKARLAAEAEKQKAQAALVQEQSAHATTYRRYEAQNQQLVQAATLCHSLANTLGVGCNFKSCIAQKTELVKWFHIDKPDYYGDNFYVTLGKFMSKLSRGQVPLHPTTYQIKDVQDAKYGKYHAYQIEAWADFFAILRAGQCNLLFSSLIKRLKGSEE